MDYAIGPNIQFGLTILKNDADRSLGKEMLIENVEQYVCNAAIAASISSPREHKIDDMDVPSDDENKIRLFECKTQVENSNLLPNISVTETGKTGSPNVPNSYTSHRETYIWSSWLLARQLN